jgi:hypothetical protein
METLCAHRQPTARADVLSMLRVHVSFSSGGSDVNSVEEVFQRFPLSNSDLTSSDPLSHGQQLALHLYGLHLFAATSPLWQLRGAIDDSERLKALKEHLSKPPEDYAAILKVSCVKPARRCMRQLRFGPPTLT